MSFENTKDSNDYIKAITYHTIFLSVCVGGQATNLTIYILLGIDFLINFYFVIVAFKTKRNPTEENVEKLMQSVQILVIGESLEIIIPLAYLVCFIAAFHGPNSGILGNVKNGYWQYQSVDDLWVTINNLLFLVFFDFVSLVIAAIFLFVSSSINLFHVYLHLMKEYGVVFAIHQAYLLEYLFCTIAIACAFDFTLQFDWVLNTQKWQNITLSSTQ